MAPEPPDLVEVRRRLYLLAEELDAEAWRVTDPGRRMDILCEAGHLRLVRELAFQGTLSVPAAALWTSVGADRVLHWSTIRLAQTTPADVGEEPE